MACGFFRNDATELHVTDVVPIKLGLEALGENESSRSDPMAPTFRLEALSGDRRGQGPCTWHHFPFKGYGNWAL